jgi:hypothetical protein
MQRGKPRALYQLPTLTGNMVDLIVNDSVACPLADAPGQVRSYQPIQNRNRARKRARYECTTSLPIITRKSQTLILAAGLTFHLTR